MIRLRELRLAQGWTQAQLGSKIGLAKTTISGYEKGDHFLDPPTIAALCRIFRCTSDYLLGISDTSLPAITPEEDRLLKAYAGASERDRELVDHILGLDVPESKKDASAS